MGTVSHHRRDDLLKNSVVLADQVEARLTRLLIDPRSDDDDIAVGRLRIVAGDNLSRFGETHPVGEVHRVPLGPIAPQVH